MSFTNIFSKLRKITWTEKTHLRILAISFVLIIIYVGTAIVPEIPDIVNTNQDEEFLGMAPFVKNIRNRLYHEYVELLDHDYSDPLRDRGFYVNLNSLIARTIGQRRVNRIIKLNNDHLLDPVPETFDMGLSITQMTRLWEMQKNYGREFIFVMTPSQNSKYEDLMPAGFNCYANSSADLLADGLRANGIPVFDLRDELVSDGLTQADLFFVTDHHWTPRGGFWAYNKIADYLVDEGLIDPIEPMYLDINEYHSEVYQNWFLGTSGWRAGRFLAGLDDFEIIYPKFETNLTLELPWVSEVKQGAYEDILLNRNENIKQGDFFDFRPYNTYLYFTYMIIQNHNATNDLTMLTLHDSFGNVSCIYFPFIAETNHLLDMRAYPPGEFEAYYNELLPDIIIVLVSPEELFSPITRYDFFNDY